MALRWTKRGQAARSKEMRLAKRLKDFLTAPYNVLMGFLILLFIARPFSNATVYPGIWKIVLTLSLLLAIFNVRHKRSLQIIASILAIPSVIFSWLVLFHQGKDTEAGLAISSMAFLLVCGGSIIYDVVLRARVTVETLRGVVCAYFLIAFLFGYFYTVTEYFIPGSFAIRGQLVDSLSFAHFFSEMLYFSFVTLLTIGFGDIVATHDMAQTVVILEGIVGQFYVAILVARIVAVYSLFSQQGLLRRALKKKHTTRREVL